MDIDKESWLKAFYLGMTLQQYLERKMVIDNQIWWALNREREAQEDGCQK
jgi:hypothetical protein